MIAASAALQQALFARIDAHAEISSQFRSHINAHENWPQFSFDGIASQALPNDNDLDIVLHDIDFSIWADAEAVADASDLAARLSDIIDETLVLDGHSLIHLVAQRAAGGLQSGEKLWQLQLRFHAITRKNN